MNKKVVFGAVIVIILILAGVFLFNNAETSSDENNLDVEEATDLSDLQSDDEVFNQIDNSVNYIE